MHGNTTSHQARSRSSLEKTLAYTTKPSYDVTITGTLSGETSATPLKLYVCTSCSGTSAALSLSIFMSVVVLAAAATKLI
ncbi:hypothetical protein DPMN_190283 [Dreissena polymorpha]|uniref:Uncharacterized protein n=1 Tax=Dreissena polymorpha TaxID=45954 RepID=A0A9D4DWI4_DREPO|nr:hypothetical protein DPMN_190283 [Dreissena polymorpha]